MVKKSNNKKPTELDGVTWLKYSISVWDDIEKTKEEIKLKHPAMFPSELAKRLILMYTHTGDWVLDPFLGVGSTLVAAKKAGRSGIGIEISKEYTDIAKKRLERIKKPKKVSQLTLRHIDSQINTNTESSINDIPNTEHLVYNDDANNLDKYVKSESMDLCITSPPYWDILTQKRTADMKEIRTYNGTGDGDLSKIHDYNDFLTALERIFKKVYISLKPDKRCAVVVMDIRKKDKFYPYHMDLTERMRNIGFILDDIIIWDRRKEYNNLKPLGYPYVFRINKVHEYIMIYQKQCGGD